MTPAAKEGLAAVVGLVAKWREEAQALRDHPSYYAELRARGIIEEKEKHANELESTLSALTAEAGKVELPRPFAYSQFSHTDDPDVIDHHMYVLPPCHEVPDGAMPLFTDTQMRLAIRLALSTATPAGEWPDIEVMRNVFDSLPTTTAKVAYSAVKTYIDIAHHMAGKPSPFDALLAASPRGAGELGHE
jgi:hypothetical protein